MLFFQFIIFISIFISCKISRGLGNAVTVFWIIVTLVEVFMPWLMIVQFIVICAARSAANE